MVVVVVTTTIDNDVHHTLSANIGASITYLTELLLGSAPDKRKKERKKSLTNEGI
jgi:hypothetical protein